MKTNNKYFAFISYKREDEEWAIWFHHELENYHLPATLNGRADLPSEFRPVFRDIDELKAGNLPEQIYDALATSAYLIVICSPNSAKSKWVNKEIGDFIEIGKAKGIDNVRNIFPFIVDGRPHAKIESEECFPQALLELAKDQERIGGNVNESGRDKAFVKVLAGMLPNVAFDELWNRYERDKAEEQRKERERQDNSISIFDSKDVDYSRSNHVKRIFISYKRIDKDKVFKIKDKIEQIVGEPCWIDLDGIESDAQFMSVIMEAINNADIFLFMYSKAHQEIQDFETDWTVREINFAQKKKKRIVFINIDHSQLSDSFEFMFGTKQQVDALSDEAMKKLCVDVKSWLINS